MGFQVGRLGGVGQPEVPLAPASPSPSMNSLVGVVVGLVVGLLIVLARAGSQAGRRAP